MLGTVEKKLLMSVPGRTKNIQGFGRNAAGRDYGLESAFNKHNLIYACYILYILTT